jgi:uncharacterized membrane protein YfcA
MVYAMADEVFAHLSAHWWEMSTTWLCAACLAASGSLAAAAGIGGGGIIVAVLMFCGDMAPHDAVPMSKAVVFAGTVVSSGMNMRKRAPDGSPLIDFDIVAAVVPLALAGTLVGVWLNSRVAPEFIVFVLIGTFIIMIATTSQKLAEQILEESAWTGHEDESPRGQPAGGVAALLHEDAALRDARREKFREKLLKDERRNMTLVWSLAALLASVILGGVLHKHMLDCHLAIQSGTKVTCESALLNLLFGNPHHFLGGIHGMGLAAFPLVASGMCCLICFLIIYVGFSARKPRGGEVTFESLRYSIMAFVTGVLAGLVGIGGGLIFSPFMVWSGLNPHVAVATSTFCVIFTSTSTTLQYSLMGRIFFPLAVVYGLCNQFSSYFGTVFIHRIQDRYPLRKSYPTAIVLVAVMVSAVLTLLKLHAMAVEHFGKMSAPAEHLRDASTLAGSN